MTYTAPSFPLPSIHLNGTGRERLLADYQSAYKLLCTACDAFAEIEFNARDYYVQGDYAFNAARTERDRARLHFGALKQYLEAHLLHLAVD
jgi:hypothetical protein